METFVDEKDIETEIKESLILCEEKQILNGIIIFIEISVIIV